MRRRSSRARIDDVGIMVAVDVEATAVAAAGGDGAVADRQPGHRRRVVGIVQRIRDTDRLAPVATRDDVPADVDDDAADRSRGHRGRGRAIDDVALGERIQDDGRGVQVRGRARDRVAAPVRTPDLFDGGVDLAGGWQVSGRRRAFPHARHGFGRCVERSAAAVPPCVEHAEHVVQLRRTQARLVRASRTSG